MPKSQCLGLSTEKGKRFFTYTKGIWAYFDVVVRLSELIEISLSKILCLCTRDINHLWYGIIAKFMAPISKGNISEKALGGVVGGGVVS